MWENVVMITITYFGEEITIPEESVSVATDHSGNIYAYSDVPIVSAAAWYGRAIYSIGRRFDLCSKWDKTLHIVKKINN